MAALQDPTIELLRAALDPASQRAHSRKDSPVCQLLIRAAQADLAAGGVSHINQLAVGVGMAATFLTGWLAQKGDKRPADLIAALGRTGPGHAAPALDLLETTVTGLPGLHPASQFMARLLHEDQEGYYNLIIDLADYAAACIQMLETLEVRSRQQILDSLEDAIST